MIIYPFEIVKRRLIHCFRIEIIYKEITKMTPKKLYWNDHSTINSLTQSLLAGKLSRFNFQKLNTLKGARTNKPYLVLIANSEKILKFVEPNSLSPQILNLLKQCWPGPLTVVFKAKNALPNFLKSPDGTIALRCPQHSGLLQLLNNFDGLFSTSANRSSQPATNSISEVDFNIVNAVKYLVDEPMQIQGNTMASTIIDATVPDSLKLLREGAFPITKLEQIYGTKIIK